jgi:outer membrane lipoprotein-sorting protein
MRYHSAGSLICTLVVVASLALGGCARRTAPPDNQVTEPEQLYDSMLARLDSVESARIVATLEYYADDGRAKLKQAVLVRRPASLRIETLSPFDSTLNVLASNGVRLKYFDLQNERFFEGQATADNVAKLIPIYISPRDLVNVMLGGPPTDKIEGNPENWELEWDRRRGAYSLIAPTTGGGSMELFVQHRTWTVSGAVARDDQGEKIYEVRSGNFEAIENGVASMLVPRRIQFLMPERNIDASLDVERYDLNPDLADQFFELTAPEGMSVEGL